MNEESTVLPEVEADTDPAPAEPGDNAAEVTESRDGEERSEEDGEREVAESEEEGVDYARLAKEDLAALKELFPEARTLGSLSDLPNATRYGELRDLGLSPAEAYRAVCAPVRPRGDTRHLAGGGRRLSHAGASMPYGEMEAARALFPGLSASDILSLYRRCTK